MMRCSCGVGGVGRKVSVASGATSSSQPLGARVLVSSARARCTRLLRPCPAAPRAAAAPSKVLLYALPTLRLTQCVRTYCSASSLVRPYALTGEQRSVSVQSAWLPSYT
jgi:hypothetical protein